MLTGKTYFIAKENFLVANHHNPSFSYDTICRNYYKHNSYPVEISTNVAMIPCRNSL